MERLPSTPDGIVLGGVQDGGVPGEREARWQLPLTIALGAVVVIALIVLAVAWHNAAGIFFAALVILHLVVRLVLRHIRRGRRRRVQPVDRGDALRDVPKSEPPTAR